MPTLSNRLRQMFSYKKSNSNKTKSNKTNSNKTLSNEIQLYKKGHNLKDFQRINISSSIAPAIASGGITLIITGLAFIAIELVKLKTNNSKLSILLNELANIISFFASQNYEKNILIKKHLAILYEYMAEFRHTLMFTSLSPKEDILNITTQLTLLNSFLIMDMKMKNRNKNFVPNKPLSNVSRKETVVELEKIINKMPIEIQKEAVKLLQVINLVIKENEKLGNESLEIEKSNENLNILDQAPTSQTVRDILTPQLNETNRSRSIARSRPESARSSPEPVSDMPKPKPKHKPKPKQIRPKNET